MEKTVYVCEDCGKVMGTDTWCPKCVYSVLIPKKVKV